MANSQDAPGAGQDRMSALEMRVGALEDRLAPSTITPDDIRSYHKVATHLQSLGASGPPGVWSCANVVGGPVWTCSQVAPVWSCAQPATVWNCAPHPAAMVSGPPVWTCSPHPAAVAGGPAWSCSPSPAAVAAGPAWSCGATPAAASGPAWSCSPTPKPEGLADAPPHPQTVGGSGSFGTLGR
jgi:hypothetical protein